MNSSQPTNDIVNRRGSIASYVALGTISVLSFIVQPALVQGFVTVLGLSDSQSVQLAGIEMAGVAAATVLVALIGERADWRLLTGLAILVAAAGDAWSALQLQSLDRLTMARCVAGFGHGALISLSFTFIGLTRRVERNLALYLVSLLTYGAVGIGLAPTLFRSVGLGGIFGAFAVATLAALILVPHVPRSANARIEAAPSARQLRLPWLITALASILAYNLAQGIAWAILFLVGTAAAIGEQQVANALLASQVAAVAGALGAVFFAERWRRIPAIAFGIIGGAACIALLLGSLPLPMYVLAVCGFNLLWNFVLPFMLGAVGDMDLKGRMMSPAIAMQMIGLGLGPLLTAPLISGGSYRSAEMLCIGGFVASLLLLAPPLLAHRAMVGRGPSDA